MAERPSLEQIDRVIHGFYDAALEPARWQNAVDSMGDLLGGCAAGMSVQSESSGPFHLCYSRLDPEQMRIMEERYFTTVTNPMVAAMKRLPPAKALAREAVVPDNEYFSTGLYRDVFRSQRLAHAAVVCAHKSADAFVPLGLFHGSGRDAFEDWQFSVLRIVLPHLEKALQIYLRIGMADASRAAVESSMDCLPFGTLLVDLEGRVWRLNRAAETIVHTMDGLSLRRGRLHAATPAEDRVLQGLILSALAAASEPGLGAGGRLAVNRPSMTAPLGVLVASLTGGVDIAGGRPGAIVFVTDPDATISPCASALVDLFGLTPAQAKLTSLLATGLSVEEAASRSGIKVSTARLHLKRTFEKTGATRQGNLVRLALTSVASLGVNSGDGDRCGAPMPRLRSAET